MERRGGAYGGRSGWEGAAALQPSLDTAHSTPPLRAVSSGSTRRVCSPLVARGAPAVRPRRRACVPVAAERVPSGRNRIRRGHAGSGHDAGPPARGPARQRAATGVRRPLACVVARSDGTQNALRTTARACRARRRAAADRLVSLLRMGGRSERSRPDCGTGRLFRPPAATAPAPALATRRGGDAGARPPALPSGAFGPAPPVPPGHPVD